VFISGREATALEPQKRDVGFVFQHYAPFTHMTVWDNIAFGLTIRRRPKEEVRARVAQLLELVQLKGLDKRYPSQLSGGQRQRMALARALAAEPKVLLLDEPSSGLAQAETEELGPLIGRIGKETGCAVLVIEHDLALVRALAQRMYALDRGRVIAEGTPDDVLAADQVVQSYLAGSEAALRRSGLLAGV
jgi:sulfate transport system ATP-binding protein